MAQLVPLRPDTTPSIVVARPVMLVGRHVECDVRIDLAQVSRRHCCLAIAYDRLIIRDLGSRHGIRLNGRPIDEAELAHGDEVAIGHLLYRVDAPRAHPAQPPPAPPPAPARPAADLPPSLIDFEDEFIPLDD